MKIYIDIDCKCHTTNPDNAFKEVETPFFDGKCDAFIEGYRFVPEGESWVRADGVVFQGEMVTPWKDYGELDSAQREYEREQLTELQNEKTELNTSYQEGINSI